MARPKKATVNYFPHDTVHGSTMQVLESKWGNDGYAFWFKVLESLGNHDGHYIDCRKPAEWELLTAKTRLNDETAAAILNMLAKLEAVDGFLWNKHKVIFCPKFLGRIEDAYRKRKDSLPTPEKVYSALNIEPNEFRAGETRLNGVNDAGSTERERERESNNKTLSSSGDEAVEFYLTKKRKKLSGKRLETFNQFWEAFDYKTGKAEAADAWLEIPTLTDATATQAIQAAKQEALSRPRLVEDGKTPKMAQGWISGRRWEDEKVHRSASIPPLETAEERYRKMGLPV
jgi:hypothetical protein